MPTFDLLRRRRVVSLLAAFATAWVSVATAQGPSGATTEAARLSAAIDRYYSAKTVEDAQRAFEAIRVNSKLSARAGLTCAVLASPPGSPVYDPVAARACLESSARAGNAESQHRLAVVLLESGPSDKKARDRAVTLLKAASRSNPDSVFLLAMLRADSSNDPEAARREVIEKAAAAGFAPAQYRLASLLVKSDDPQLQSRARQLLESAAAQQYTEAVVDLALVLEKDGRDADVPRIIELLQSASRGGSPRADYALGMRYVDAIGVKRDAEAGFRLVRRSAFAGFAPAQYGMGFLLTEAIGTAPDDVAALEWFKRSAAQGDALAMRGVGNAYANGWGVGKSISLASQWYCKAAQRGEPNSIAFVKLRPPADCPLPGAATAPAPAKQSAFEQHIG